MLLRMLPIALVATVLVGCTWQSNAPSASVDPTGKGPDLSGPVALRAGQGYESLPTAVRSTPREKNTPKYGPPPPGYVRILGGAVPAWDASYLRMETPRSNPWTLLGPRPIVYEYWSGDDDASGRVVSIAPHPTDPDIVYIASASGGVWKTVDGGVSWQPMSDELASLNHGAITLHPNDPDTVYVGTGEYTTGSLGDGLFRSTDGAVNWERLADTSEVGEQCSKIVVDPLNPLRIHVTGDAGYARSTDGGYSWSWQLAGAASDLVVNPNDPNIVYVGMHGDGIYRSTNGGDSFSKLTSGLPTSDVRRIILAISPSNPSVLYAAFINSNAGLRGMYRTGNGGNSWTRKSNTPNFPYPQGWYDACVAVDPNDENIVYAGGVFPTYAEAGVIKTTNGGDSWTDITISPIAGQLHPDMHAIAFGPDGTLWIGNDGGVWKSVNAGQSWINTNPTLTVTQNYQIALHPTDQNQIIGGTQDNGTVGRELDVLEWPQVLSGDGGFAAYDHATPARQYVTYVYLSVYRLYGGDWANISGPWSNDPRNFIAPLVMDPQDPDTLLGGTNRVWRTQNASGAASWTAISGTSVSDGGTLNAIAIAATASNTIYTGSSTGAVYVTTNASSWYNRSSGLPSGEVSDICIDPNDPGVAYVSYYNRYGARVLRTASYGNSWNDVTGTLPGGVDASALAVDWTWDPPYLYVGSGAGVYESSDHGANWTKDGSDLPNVNIGDLKIDEVRRTITAGTYGRGAWRKLLPSPDLVGDVNCDGFVDFGDINPFVLALIDPAGYASQYPDCDIMRADIDEDGEADFGDINPFVALLLP